MILATVLELIGLPAALLLGPMLAGILLATNGGALRAPRVPVIAAQAVVGCLIARAMTADIVLTFLRDWPLFLGVVLVIVATSGLLGWGIARFKVLPGSTAIWGTAPGAAQAMMVLAGDFGADARLVAFMQYLRVVCVAGLASVVARVWVGPIAVDPPHRVVSRRPLDGFRRHPGAGRHRAWRRTFGCGFLPAPCWCPCSWAPRSRGAGYCTSPCRPGCWR